MSSALLHYWQMVTFLHRPITIQKHPNNSPFQIIIFVITFLRKAILHTIRAPRVLTLNISPHTPHTGCILLPRGRPEIKEVRYLWNRVTMGQIVHPHEDYSHTGIRNSIIMHIVLRSRESKLRVVFCFAILKCKDKVQRGFLPSPGYTGQFNWMAPPKHSCSRLSRAFPQLFPAPSLWFYSTWKMLTFWYHPLGSSN